jgi:ElaB/YqjD/DUF883 family membrane-anchored ribosome-binding protein
MPSTLSSQEPVAGNVADHAADAAGQAIRATRRVTDRALKRLNETVEAARGRTSPVIDRWTTEADAAARRSVAAVREKALRARGATTDYVRDEPLKAVLIAAAFGAALLALVQLLRED